MKLLLLALLFLLPHNSWGLSEEKSIVENAMQVSCYEPFKYVNIKHVDILDNYLDFVGKIPSQEQRDEWASRGLYFGDYDTPPTYECTIDGQQVKVTINNARDGTFSIEQNGVLVVDQLTLCEDGCANEEPGGTLIYASIEEFDYEVADKTGRKRDKKYGYLYFEGHVGRYLAGSFMKQEHYYSQSLLSAREGGKYGTPDGLPITQEIVLKELIRQYELAIRLRSEEMLWKN